MTKCDLKGRDCIEKNAAKTFNCSATCAGIYADVQLIGNTIEEEMGDENSAGSIETELRKEKDDDELLDKLLKRIAELEKKIETVEVGLQEKAEELEEKKYKLLIAEYRKFKSKNVKHFRLSSTETPQEFRESFLTVTTMGMIF